LLLFFKKEVLSSSGDHQMDLGIKGKRALCAGASAGMGKAAAMAIAGEGAEVFLSARGEARLFAAAREIADATGAVVTPIVADHGTSEGRARLLAACPEPDILIATTAPPRMTPSYLDVTEAEWMHSLATTLVGPIELMRQVLEGMALRGFGRVVNIGTGAAKNPAEVRLLSGPARAALCNYTVSVARRLAKHNVTINNILPGMFHTAATAERFGAMAAANGTSYEEECRKFVEEWRIPAGRFGDPADIGAFCAMLCSTHAGLMTGQSLVIDGGIGNHVF
jgi:3-oxoacyl-[acyl-carrier protein] reductase